MNKDRVNVQMGKCSSFIQMMLVANVRLFLLCCKAFIFTVCVPWQYINFEELYGQGRIELCVLRTQTQVREPMSHIYP